jgi:hypothetical protein
LLHTPCAASDTTLADRSALPPIILENKLNNNQLAWKGF